MNWHPTQRLVKCLEGYHTGPGGPIFQRDPSILPCLLGPELLATTWCPTETMGMIYAISKSSHAIRSTARKFEEFRILQFLEIPKRWPKTFFFSKPLSRCIGASLVRYGKSLCGLLCILLSSVLASCCRMTDVVRLFMIVSPMPVGHTQIKNRKKKSRDDNKWLE